MHCFRDSRALAAARGLGSLKHRLLCSGRVTTVRFSNSECFEVIINVNEKMKTSTLGNSEFRKYQFSQILIRICPVPEYCVSNAKKVTNSILGTRVMPTSRTTDSASGDRLCVLLSYTWERPGASPWNTPYPEAG